MRWLLFALIFMLLVFQYRLWFGEGSFAQQVELTRKVAQQQGRNERLAERNRILAEEVEGLRTDPGAIEERARTDLGMIRSDETFFLVLDKRRPLKAPAPEPLEPLREGEEEAREVIPEGLFEQ